VNAKFRFVQIGERALLVKYAKKDAIICVIVFTVLVLIAVFMVVYDVRNDRLDFVATSFAIIGGFGLVLAGIFGIFEFAYSKGAMIIVPDFYIKHKEEHLSKQIEKFGKMFFNENLEYTKQYGDEVVKNILNNMGIKADLLESLNNEEIESITKNVTDIETARGVLKGIVFCSDKIVDLHKPPGFPPNPKLRYHIKFSELMLHKERCDKIVNIMELFIRHTFSDKQLDEIDACMISHRDNYLLGFNVGKKLEKEFVKIYEGVNVTKKSLKIILTYDVLCEPKHIFQSIETLRQNHPHCEIISVFCLIHYNVYNAEYELRKRTGCDVHCLLELSEDDITSELSKKGASLI